MELEELKQKWNSLDDKLSKSEVYNRRVLIETIRSKNQTIYEHFHKEALRNLFAVLIIAAGIIPLLHVKGIFHDASFYVLEAVCILGVFMVICRLVLLSHFNVMKTPVEQLRAISNYKRGYILENIIGSPLAVFGICTTVFLEHTASAFGYIFIVLGAVTGAVCAWTGWKKHQGAMQEIERNISELREME